AATGGGGGGDLDAGELELPPEGSPVGDAVAGADTPGVTDTADPGDEGPTSDAAPEAGEFGAPCQANGDCFSGYCVPSDIGHVCTKACVDECPGGWNCQGVANGIDVAFICVPDRDRLCEPCTVDFQCNGGLCLSLPGGSACTSPCESGE